MKRTLITVLSLTFLLFQQAFGGRLQNQEIEYRNSHEEYAKRQLILDESETLDKKEEGFYQEEDVVKRNLKISRVICGGHLSLAIVENLYKDEFEGFTFETVQFHDWLVLLEALRNEEVDGSFMLSPLAMHARKSGIPIKVVLMADRNGNGMIVNEKIYTVNDLKGKIIATPADYSQHNVLLYKYLTDNGIKYSDIIHVAMPPRDMIVSLRRGEIDGFVVGEPEANKARFLYADKLFAISPDIWPNHLDHVFVIREKIIKKNPEFVQKLISALVKGGQFIEANPQEAAKIGEAYTGSNAAIFEEVLTSPPDWISFDDMIPKKEDFQKMQEYLIKMGLFDNEMNIDELIEDRFVKKAYEEFK